jgi:hypothetical protein
MGPQRMEGKRVVADATDAKKGEMEKSRFFRLT